MSQILVAYFSASGITAAAAKKLAYIAGGDLYEIRPAQPYKKRDLNWLNPFSRSTREMKGKLPYPELADGNAHVAEHDLIFLGFPIWWYRAPTIINRFLQSYNFAGKRIVLFATSGGSGFGKTAEKLREDINGNAILEEGILMNGELSESELIAWVERIKTRAQAE